MADQKTVWGQVVGTGYLFRGHKIPVGTFVRLTESQLKETQQINPPFVVGVTEPKEGKPVVDLTLGAKMAQAGLPATGAQFTDAAKSKAGELGLSDADFTGRTPSGSGGRFTVADVEQIAGDKGLSVG